MLPLVPAVEVTTPAEDAAAAAAARALNARLLAHPSATAVLQSWCAEHRIADPATIRAEVERGVVGTASVEQRARLRVSADEVVAYRRVRLMCGDAVLSEAENWYVPARLTPEMRDVLEGDTPFGAVIRPLVPSRTTLSTEFSWSGQGADQLLRHRALVIAASGLPLAEVSETYMRGIVPVR